MNWIHKTVIDFSHFLEEIIRIQNRNNKLDLSLFTICDLLKLYEYRNL